MKKFLLFALIGSSFVGLALVAKAQVVVPGTSDPWLAGQPNGTTASSGDTAPAESPVYAGSVTAGTTITWSATGLVFYEPGTPSDGPNGELGYIIDDPAQNGIAGVNGVAVDGLMGVFLGPSTPSGTDGYGWYNNVGAFDVTLQNVTASTPDGGSTLAMMGVTFGLLGFVRRKTS
jgi:hypothetical protein